MQAARAVVFAAATAWCGPALAVEGPTVAGPIGGNDIRSAVLPPPGLYGGVVLLHASTMISLIATATPSRCSRMRNSASRWLDPFSIMCRS
jgi:hypothetical protein